MAWTEPKTWLPGAVLTASELNEQLRDNTAHLYETSLPVGGITMFSGDVSTLPSNWKLCDGTAGTPDLRGRFIVGAGDSYSQGDTGGANEVALTAANMPAHVHGSGSLSTSSAGAHTHSMTYRNLSNASGVSQTYVNLSSSSGSGNAGIDAAGAHTHSISGNTSSVGSGLEHENRPPYYALAYIMRVA